MKVTFDWGGWRFLLPGLERAYNLVRAVDSGGERLLARARWWVFELLCAFVLPAPRPLPGTPPPSPGSARPEGGSR